MKLRRAVTPVALIALAVAALGYAYLVDRTAVSASDRGAGARRVFPRFALGEVRELELEVGAARMVLERAAPGDGGGAGWTIKSPVREPADASAVDALLGELDAAVRAREVSPAHAVGLDAPRVRGKVKVGALEYAFALGGSAPVPDGAAYLRVDGEGTFVVDKALVSALLRGADAYRERVLFPYAARDVARLEVRRPPSAEGFVLAKGEHGFRLDDGVRASRGAVDRALGGLGAARAESFLADADADRLVASAPDAVVVVAVPREAGRPRIELRLGGVCPGHAEQVAVIALSPARRSACLLAATVEPLRQRRQDLVDRGLFRARKDEVAELRLEPVGSPGTTLDLARRGNGWHQRSPEDRDLDGAEADRANGLAQTLADLQATEVRPGAPGETLAANGRVTLVGVDGTTEVVEVAVTAGGATVRRADDGAILTMPADAASLLATRRLAASVRRED